MAESSTERLIASITDRIDSRFTPLTVPAGSAAGSVTGAPELEYSWSERGPASAQEVAYLASITRQLADELEEKGRALASMRAMLFPGMDADAIRDHLLALADGLGIELGDGW